MNVSLHWLVRRKMMGVMMVMMVYWASKEWHKRMMKIEMIFVVQIVDVVIGVIVFVLGVDIVVDVVIIMAIALVSA